MIRIKKIAMILIGVLLTIFTIGSTNVWSNDNKQNYNIMENSDDFSSEFSFASNTQLNSNETTTYQEYYLQYGSARASNTIIDELYIKLDEKITYALKDPKSRTSYSITEAYNLSTDKDSYFYNVFINPKTKGSVYLQLQRYYDKNKNSDGYAPINETIIATLKIIAKNLGNISDENKWDSLCFYKPFNIEGTANPYEGATDLGEQKLVYGDEALKDEDAFVLLVMGDGFTNAERDTFYNKAVSFAEYMMNTSPFSDFKDTIKIYALSVDSKESGISRDADTQAEAENSIKDTYFETGFWCGGMQRLISISRYGLMKMNKMIRYIAPNADFSGLLVNSERYGGSGGTYCTCSLNDSATEIFIHEIAHTIANLADEYYAGNSYFGTFPNMTNQSDINKLPWADFYGLDGVAKYAYTDDVTNDVITYGGTTWYKPCSKTCKMEVLVKVLEDKTTVPVDFCPVCSEALRKSICKYSNVTKIFYQPYNRVFKDDGYAYKLSDSSVGFEYSILDYILIRKANNESALSLLDDNLIHITFKDSEGNTISNQPTDAGTYTVNVIFDGNSVYDKAEIEFEYTIKPFKEEKVFLNCVNEIKATLDYNEKYKLIMNAYTVYETVNHDDESIIAAKAEFDSIVEEFNNNVDLMNKDSVTSVNIASNLITSFTPTILVSAVLCFLIKKFFGANYK